MSYTWTTGETITAEKLNKTCGYDVIISGEYDDDDGFINLTLESGTHSGLVSAIQNGTFINGLLNYTYNDINYPCQLASYLYIPENNLVSVGFSGYSVNGGIELHVFAIFSDGSVEPD